MKQTGAKIIQKKSGSQHETKNSQKKTGGEAVLVKIIHFFVI